jgi:signal peptidase
VSLPSASQRRRAGDRLATLAVVLAAILAVVVGAAAAFGSRPEVVLTGSMQPAIEPNDVVIAKQIPAAAMRVGDIVSFGAPHAPGITLTHRVRSIQAKGAGTLAVVTRGDANRAGERWTVARSATVGRVDATLPKLGVLTAWARDPLQRTIVFLAIGMAVLFAGLRMVWRR